MTTRFFYSRASIVVVDLSRPENRSRNWEWFSSKLTANIEPLVARRKENTNLWQSPRVHYPSRNGLWSPFWRNELNPAEYCFGPNIAAKWIPGCHHTWIFFSNPINEPNAFRRIDLTKNMVNSFSRYVWAERIFCRIQFAPPKRWAEPISRWIVYPERLSEVCVFFPKCN